MMLAVVISGFRSLQMQFRAVETELPKGIQSRAVKPKTKALV